MDLASVHTLYGVLAKDRFDVLYSGLFHDEHTANLISLGEDAATSGGKERSHRQRLSFVMVEAYQNIVRHRARLSPEMERGTGRCLFLLRAKEQGDEVIAMDPVPDHETEQLKEVLARIGGADVKQLKELFLDRLRDGTRTVRGGAGLGLIEMARRSGNSIRHSLLPLDEEHRLFLLQVMVGGPVAEVTPNEEVAAIHAAVVANDILLMCRCGRSAAAQEAVMHMIERDIDEGQVRNDAMKRAFLAATEWLSAAEISDRSFIAVGREAEGYSLVAGGCATAEVIDGWMGAVERINALTPTDRERHYRNSLLGRGESIFSMGLLELARITPTPLRSARFSVTEGTRFLLEARIR